MEFRILGPLELVHQGKLIEDGSPRERITLATLLLGANSVIPLDRLIESLWDDAPPRTARTQVHICISAVRRLVTECCGLDLISTRSPGYSLNLGETVFDARVFDHQLKTARTQLKEGDVAAAAGSYRRALALWRGPALAGIDSRLLQQSVIPLNERRLTAIEECMEAELRAGRHKEIVGELVQITNEHPLREQFRSQLMVALYRSGRQAEALEVYRTTRRVFADELGIEPGPALRHLQAAILSGDLSVDPAAPPSVAVSPPAPRAPKPADETTVPRLLPSAITDFTGRDDLHGWITTSLTSEVSGRKPPLAVPITVIFGRVGVGKTTLAIQAAHSASSAFPDGQLFAQLRVGNRAVSPAEVLERFLRALGVPGHAIPPDVGQRAELYRDLLGHRKVLVVLDDAMSEQQVTNLLPGNPHCEVIITSRSRLTGLSAAHRHEIGPLQLSDAIEMIGRVSGPGRLEAEREAVSHLCRLCGNLPLSLRIVAARLAARPQLSIATLAERLRDESMRLDELNRDDMGLRASISLSYEALSPNARRLFRLLALYNAPDFASWVAGPLLDMGLPAAENYMEELAETYFLDVEQYSVGEPVRYRFHDIMRPFAHERLMDEETPTERRAGLGRLIGALLYLASEAHKRQYAGDYLLPKGTARRWRLPSTYEGQLLSSPLAWYEAERTSIMAAIRQAAASQLPQHAWELALSSVALFETQGYFDDWRESHELALKAVCQAGDRGGEAAVRYSLGSLYMFEQHNDDAVRQLNRAADLYATQGNQYGTALVQRNLAVIDRRNGDLERALSRWEEAVSSFQVLDDRLGEAHSLYGMAQVQMDYGEDIRAGKLLQQAWEICLEIGNQRVGTQVQMRIGELSLRSGDHSAAATAFHAVLDATRESGDRIGECYGLIGVGVIKLKKGQLGPAIRTLSRALALAVRAKNLVMESRAAVALAEAELARGRLKGAERHAARAVRCAETARAPLVAAQAVIVKGRILRVAGESDRAEESLRDAWHIVDSLTLPRTIALGAEIDRLIAEPGAGSGSVDRSLG